MRSRLSVRFRLGCVAAGLGFAAVDASAQFPVASGPPMVVAAPALTSSTPIVTNPGVTYATPRRFGLDRRSARTANRYTVARPVYAGRPGVTFAPYSDYYFPRTIGARETVYTAAPGGSVPVGEAAFRRPAPVGVPVFPR